ncbi:hypothetical protein E8E13_003515 [Curvularia kusanoi]|uniref:Telomeric single stranded DNA binding POT1/Cdc13 domain-containing protein n=1 Tax=Curvularia kusanoi TaxID=90978 RepID=A0A9P4TBK3_CURKU|nr:hypothetical protein E8E13_003515 [Curvularia kusanoi]
MEHIRIPALRPDLHAIESKQIKAVVTLIWPYSSSQRQFALLLAEPDFRLRRNKGQVRARFTSTSARVLATTGVGIGDEVLLSLHGAQFVQDGAVSTPGKSIDWELVYTQTVAISVRRNGAEIASLDIVDAVPTPAPRSPVKKPAAAPSPLSQWSSPAFLKRARLSDGPFFDPSAYDRDDYDGHDKKRRRKSYRDWTAWTYAARTPSPDKEDMELEDELEEALSSPSRPQQLPKTPISPSRLTTTSVAAPPAYDSDYVEESTIADSAEGDTTVDDGDLQKTRSARNKRLDRPTREELRDGDHIEQYHGSSDTPLHSQYDFGGDTEVNTEDEDEDESYGVPDSDAVDAYTAEVATDLDVESGTVEEPDSSDSEAGVNVECGTDAGAASGTEEDIEVGAMRPIEQSLIEGEGTTIDETVPEIPEPAIVVEESVTIAMPPPSLPALQTDFTAPAATDLLTPIGKEPSSPNLKAVDSATLPLPSPFPGEQVGEQATSYFENASVRQQEGPMDEIVALPYVEAEAEEEVEATGDADYIMESSFFSSINSSRAGGLHQDHETAFTPVRFTFGGDAFGWPRPLDLSSPSPEEGQPSVAHRKDDAVSQEPVTDELNVAEEAVILERLPSNTIDPDSSLVDVTEDEVVDAVKSNTAQPAAEAIMVTTSPRRSSIISTVSSRVEPEEGELQAAVTGVSDGKLEKSAEDSKSQDISEVDSDDHRENTPEARVVQPDMPQVLTASSQYTANVEPEPRMDSPESNVETPAGTQGTTTVSEVVDLGSPSADEGSDSEHDISDPVERVPVDTGADSNNIDSEAVIDNVELPLTSTIAISTAQAPAFPDINDSTNRDIVQKGVVVLSSSPRQQARQEDSSLVQETSEGPSAITLEDDWEPQLGMYKPLPFNEQDEMQIDPSNDSRDIPRDLLGTQTVTSNLQDETEQPDVKMESIEDGSLYVRSEAETQAISQQAGTDPSVEILIAVPDDGTKLGELELKSVPATAPARNTRSRAKAAASPPDEEAYVSRLSASARRTRSKASFDSTNRETTSSTQSRAPARSTVTPTREVTQTSPYSLRSQSKLQSPSENTASTTPQTATASRRIRNLVRRDTDFDIVPSQTESHDLFGSMFEPSQELGFGNPQLSQGRFSDVAYVKDSEEGTSHSEGSISTLQPPDPGSAIQDEQPVTPRLKPPPASSPYMQRMTRSRSRSMGQQTIVSPSQPPRSQQRSHRVTRSTSSVTSTPQVVRAVRDVVQVSSPSSRVSGTQQGDETTPTGRKQSIAYPMLPSEREGEDEIRSSPPPSAQQPQSFESSLLGQVKSQQMMLEPPLSFQPRQPEQSFNASNLTQTTSPSATLRSFDIPLPGVQTQPAPQSPVLRTSPRRKTVAASMKSSSPTQQSSDAVSSFEDATLTAEQAPAKQTPAEEAQNEEDEAKPSIGLSTPLAYYTPLRDLIYFLNRSSHFHSASNPDILALCTSVSTPAVQAKRGPRHWTTSFTISDLSIWPASRSVAVFRAYAQALPVCEVGDVVLLRAFGVRSEKRVPALRSEDESSWCVWRYGKKVWGRKKGRYAEVRAREEVNGPEVERGAGEWGEVEKLRGWFEGSVREVLDKGETLEDVEKMGEDNAE